MKNFTKVFCTIALLLTAVAQAEASPNIISNNLTGTGSFAEGSTITFTVDTKNAGDSMTTSDSYKLREVFRNNSVGGSAYDLVKYGNFVYVAYPADIVEIYNVTDPSEPVLVNSFNPVGTSNGSVHEVEIYNNYLIVGGRNLGSSDNVAIYSLSSPTNPSLISKIDTAVFNSIADGKYDCQNSQVESMEVSDGKLYLSSDGVNSTGYRDSFCVYDISNVSSPIFIGDYEHQGNAGSFAVSGNYVYQLVWASTYSTFSGIRVLDISSPSNPTFVSEINLPVSDAAGSHKVTVNGSYLYVGTNTGDDVTVLNIANPSNLSITGSLDFADTNPNWNIGSGLSAAHPIIYAGNTNGFVGINAIDVSNPANPILKGHENGRGQYSTIPDANYVYTAGSDGFLVFEPYLLSRFCINNTNCATSASGRLGSDFEIDRLNAAAYDTNSVTWTATVGTHTITYCSDVEDTQYNFDGVSELNENDNCTDYTFTIDPPSPPVAGSCGAHATAHAYNITAWPTSSSFCSSVGGGTTAVFPAQGNSANWLCYGQDGGGDVSCTATRDAAPSCGSSSGGIYTNQPSNNLCTAGSVLWDDTNGNDGSFNWSCSGVSCSANHRPDAPVNLSVSTSGSCGGGQLFLDWDDVSGADSYSVYFSDGTWVANTIGSNLSTFTGTPGQSYTFYVRANSPLGVQSSNSGNASGVPESCPATSVIEARNVTTGGSWTTGTLTIGSDDVVEIQWASTYASSCTAAGPGFSTGGSSSGNDNTVTEPSAGNSETFSVDCDGGSSSVVVAAELADLSLAGWTIVVDENSFDDVSDTYANGVLYFTHSNVGSRSSVPATTATLERNGETATAPALAGEEEYSGQVEVLLSGIPLGGFTSTLTLNEPQGPDEKDRTNNSATVFTNAPPPNPGIFITSNRIQVRQGDTVELAWGASMSYPMDCIVEGPGITIDPATLGTIAVPETTTTTAIDAKSEYTLTCTEPVTNTIYESSVVVETVGVLQEV